MSKEYEIEVYGQKSLYGQKNRKFRIYFSEPEKGVNKDTGILNIIAGYGGDSNSKVYKKIRKNFADKYNLIVIQCDYLGYEFLNNKNQDIILKTDNIKEEISHEDLKSINGDLNKLFKLNLKKYEFDAVLKEDYDNLNDMGLIQAMDNLLSIKVVMDILEENKLNFNKRKIISYGHSHGAYLSYLCNIFAPKLFSAIIDNSAYLYPVYLETQRDLIMKHEDNYIYIYYNYLISKIVFDKEIYKLNILYSQFKNKCKIISFHGKNDNMITLNDKIEFLQKINNVEMEVIDENRIDKEVFYSANHGLDADFIKLFDYVWNKYDLASKEEKGIFTNVEYKTTNYKYSVNNDYVIPKLSYEKTFLK